MCSLPPIKGASLRSSIRQVASVNTPIVAFNSVDLLNALTAMFITVPGSTCVVAAASFKIGEATLKRYQSKIASKLPLPKGSQSLLTILWQYTQTVSFIALPSICYLIPA